MSPDAAKQLAYYSLEDNFGTLAPRGWHCFGTYGSSGSSLYVSPLPIDGEHMLAVDSNTLSGPIVELEAESGGTSGRFGVAAEIARVFPTHQAFLKRIIDEGIEPESSFPREPYPADKLKYISDDVVEYQTPGFTKGLGTEPGLIETADSISGVVIITGEDTDLIKLAVQLPPRYSGFTPVLVRHIEDDVATRARLTSTSEASEKEASETGYVRAKCSRFSYNRKRN